MMGTAGNFVVAGPNDCGGGGVAGPIETPHDDDALLELPKDSFAPWTNGSE